MYESRADLEKERHVADVIAPRWKCSAKKLPTAYFIDWVLMRGAKTAAFVEVKCRNNPKDQFPTFMLSLAKWMHGRQLSVIADVPFFVVVQWTDGIYWVNAADVQVEVGFGGRADSGDEQDMEPVVFIPVNCFKRVA